MRKYTEILEALLDTCWREHGGASNADQSYLQFRPVCASGDSFEDMEDEDPVVDEDDGTLEICVQTEGLKVCKFLSGVSCASPNPADCL